MLSSYSPGTTELMAGQRAIDALTAAMCTTLETVDVLLTPSTPITAPLIGQESVRYGDERNYAKVLERLQKYKDAVEVHEKNVESLRRELTNLYR